MAPLDHFSCVLLRCQLWSALQNCHPTRPPVRIQASSEHCMHFRHCHRLQAVPEEHFSTPGTSKQQQQTRMQAGTTATVPVAYPQQKRGTMFGWRAARAKVPHVRAWPHTQSERQRRIARLAAARATPAAAASRASSSLSTTSRSLCRSPTCAGRARRGAACLRGPIRRAKHCSCPALKAEPQRRLGVRHVINMAHRERWTDAARRRRQVAQLRLPACLPAVPRYLDLGHMLDMMHTCTPATGAKPPGAMQNRLPAAPPGQHSQPRPTPLVPPLVR